MYQVRIAIRCFALATFALAVAVATQAQATRTWVSGVGDDVNPCSRTAPCKTFAGAISKTFINGEIDALDPGGFGTLVITKSITIDGGTGSGWASILASGSAAAITVNIAVNGNDPLRQAIIKHISMNGTGASGAIGTRTAINGINFIQGSALIVQNSEILNFTTNGINVNLSSNGVVKVNNTSIESIGGDGIHLHTASGQVTAMISNSQIQDCGGDAIDAQQSVRGNLSNVVISHIAGTGIKTSGNDSIVNVDDAYITFCGTALKTNNAGIASHIRISDSIIAQNGVGIDTSLGGSVDSLQGNSLTGLNGTDGSFSSTSGKQ